MAIPVAPRTRIKICGLTREADVDAIVDGVLGLKQDPEALGSMAQACRVVGERYTREQMGLTAARLVEGLVDAAL